MLLALLAGLAGCERETPAAGQSAPQPAAAAPATLANPVEPVQNLVVICIDTVRADAFFNPAISDAFTPWLDNAQRYTNAMSASSWTIPSIATVFTGWHPGQHKAGQFQTPVANLHQQVPNILSESADTLAETLKAEGFRTAAFSGHSWLEGHTGLEQGFGQIHSRPERAQVHEVFERWLDEGPAERRFFAYLHFMEAHDWHLRPREELLARLEPLSPALRAQLLAESAAAACADPDSDICLRNQVYLLGVRDARQALARVLQALHDRGLGEDTAVLAFSDHGEEFWEHREQHLERGDPRGEYGFGHGHSLYQELLHIPLLAWHPRLSGSERSEPVGLVDLYPTARSWLGLPPSPLGLPGAELPTVAAPRPEWAGQRVLHASGIAYGPQAIATRRGDDKAIFHQPLDRFEYYDLAADPAEQQPLQDDRLALQFDVLTGDYLELPSALPVTRARLTEEHIKKLQAIGYLQGVEPEEGTE